MCEQVVPLSKITVHLLNYMISPCSDSMSACAGDISVYMYIGTVFLPVDHWMLKPYQSAQKAHTLKLGTPCQLAGSQFILGSICHIPQVAAVVITMITSINILT